MKEDSLIKDFENLHHDSKFIFEAVVSFLFYLMAVQHIKPDSKVKAFLKNDVEGICRKLEREKVQERDIMSLTTKLARSFKRDELDVLGNLAAELHILKKGLGQHFTPDCVSQLVALLTMPDDEKIRASVKDHGYFKAGDPTAGSGVMLAALAERVHELGFDTRFDLLVEARELDWFTYKMLYITLSMRDISAEVIWGDTLLNTRELVLFTPSYCNCFAPKQHYKEQLKAMQHLRTRREAA